MKNIFLITIFILLIPQIVISMITYPEYYLSKYCDADADYYSDSVIFMGMTPYYEHSRKKLSKDSSSVALIKSTNQELKCSVITNCSLLLVAPPDHHLMVTPHQVNMDRHIGFLSVHIDDKLEWIWDHKNYDSDINQDNYQDKNQTMRRRSKDKTSRRGGNVRISVEVEKVSTTWEHFTFDIMITAFLQLSSHEDTKCENEPFYFNCGNLRCLRTALTCDDQDNCGNNQDELNCGLDWLAGGLLTAGILISLIFLAAVLYLDQRPRLVMRLINERLIDEPII